MVYIAPCWIETSTGLDWSERSARLSDVHSRGPVPPGDGYMAHLHRGTPLLGGRRCTIRLSPTEISSGLHIELLSGLRPWVHGCQCLFFFFFFFFFFF